MVFLPLQAGSPHVWLACVTRCYAASLNVTHDDQVGSQFPRRHVGNALAGPLVPFAVSLHAAPSAFYNQRNLKFWPA